MKLLTKIVGSGPPVASLFALACIGVAAYSLQLAPIAHQRLEVENRIR